MTINLSLDQTLLTFALCVRKTWTTQLILVISLLGVMFLLSEKILLLICMDSQFMWRKVFDSESVHCLSIRFCSYKRHFASFPPLISVFILPHLSFHIWKSRFKIVFFGDLQSWAYIVICYTSVVNMLCIIGISIDSSHHRCQNLVSTSMVCKTLKWLRS